MRLIYITDFYYTVDSGAKTSARAHLKTLQNIYGKDNVKVIALVGAKIPEKAESDHLLIKGTKNKILLLAGCLLCANPTYLNKTGLLKIIEQVSVYQPDTVFIDNSIYGKLVYAIKELNPNILILSYYHDVKAKLAVDWMKQEPFYKKPVYKAMLVNEKMNAKYCDINLTLNTRETQLYKNVYRKTPEAELSVYMDIQLENDYFEKIRNDSKIQVLFFGGYYSPNVHGIDWFVTHVMPNLPDNYKLQIAGRGMDKLKKINYPKNVSIRGSVDNLACMYRDVDIVVSPIFEGGGMKVKMAEAMAYGKIIIASDESYEGYQEKIPAEMWNKYFYRANTAEEFVNALIIIGKRSISHYYPEIRKVYEDNFSESYAQKIIGGIIDKKLKENKI